MSIKEWGPPLHPPEGLQSEALLADLKPLRRPRRPQRPRKRKTESKFRYKLRLFSWWILSR